MKAYSVVQCPQCGSKEFGCIEYRGGLPQIRCSQCGHILRIHAAMRYSACCPKCGARLIDIEDDVKAQVKIPTSNTKWKPDFYQKCSTCKSEVGIKQIYQPKKATE